MTNKEEYYANAIIDIFDWKKLKIKRLYPERRNDQKFHQLVNG